MTFLEGICAKIRNDRFEFSEHAVDQSIIRHISVQEVYYPDTDSLYIDLSGQPSVETREISEGIVLDYGGNGNLAGIDIDNASKKVQFKGANFKQVADETPNSCCLTRHCTRPCHALYEQGFSQHTKDWFHAKSVLQTSHGL